ncbi:alpha/beta hydrolase [Vibrio sp. FNV 38]|nr:alpha/beta hydrolase [Vibrio sp. FNV 38]
MSFCLPEATLTLDWGNLAYLEHSPKSLIESKITLLFLHGWLDNAASFESTIEALTKLEPNLRCIALDLAGHGHSDHKGAGQYYSFHEYLDDISQLLVKLSASRCLIIGHSLGALLASCYSAAFPEQVAGLIQIEGVLPIAEKSDNHSKRIRQAVVSRQRLRTKPVKSMASFESALIRRSRVNEINPELIMPVVKRGTVVKSERWYWSHDPRLLSDSIYRMSPEHSLAIAKSVQCPWQVVLGKDGYADLSAQAHDCLNEDQISMIQGGHHCHMQQPQAIAEIILGLVNKI